MILHSLKKYFDALTHLFLTGLFTLLPITITITFFTVSFKFIKNILEPLQAIQIPYLIGIPHSEIILGIAAIFIAGLFLKSLVLKSCMELAETVLSQIPVVSTIYKSVKQLTSAFSPSDNASFKKVVLVKFPHQNTYGLGFLTNELPQDLAPESGKTFYTIFVPTTPNPTSGFFLIVTKEDYQEVDMSNQDAMAMIMSGGMILPKKYTTN
jgi:uncharacterized membrane protein